MSTPHKLANVDWPTVEKQIRNGKSQRAIAKSLDVHPITLSKALTRYRNLQAIAPTRKNAEAIDKFREERADILAGKQKEILQAMTSEKLAKSSAYQLAGMFSLLHEKERLERGLSTGNVGIFGLIVGLANDGLAAKDITRID